MSDDAGPASVCDRAPASEPGVAGTLASVIGWPHVLGTHSVSAAPPLPTLPAPPDIAGAPPLAAAACAPPLPWLGIDAAVPPGPAALPFATCSFPWRALQPQTNTTTNAKLLIACENLCMRHSEG